MKEAIPILQNQLEWMKNNNDKRMELEEALQTVIDDDPSKIVTGFIKWAFDNNMVPNRSLLWFDYKLNSDDVCFYELDALFKAFMSNKTIDEFKKESDDIKRRSIKSIEDAINK